MRYTISFPLATAFVLSCAAAQAEVPAVVTDMPPIQSLVAQVMGDLGTPLALLEPGASPHGFALRPSQARAIADADLIIWTGPEIAPWLDRVLDGSDTGAATLALLAAEGTHLQPYALTSAEDHAHDHGHDHGTESAEDHAAEKPAEKAGHAAGEADDKHAKTAGFDPHAWLDPDNASLWLGLIAGALAKADPANAATYAANAASAQSEIAALDARLAAMLVPAKGKAIVVFHDAYGYFTSHFGLSLAGSVSLGDATSPGAGRLAELRASIETGTPACIFPETQFDSDLVAQMAEGTDIRVGAPLDPEGSTLDAGPGLYAALLTSLATSIADCLGQS